MANLESIVQQLKQERDRLDAAITALSSVNGDYTAPEKRAGKHMSAAARAKISAAQKARWAKSKSISNNAPKRRTLSAAARKRIADAQKKRWAKFKSSQK